MANRITGRANSQNILASQRVLASDNACVAGSRARYVRNPSWPTLPTVTSAEEKLVALFAVYPDVSPSGTGPNAFAINCAGAYTVNFGDGSAAVNTATGVQTEYLFDYINSALNNTNAPVTLTDAGDLITRNNHGYTNGMPVQFYNIVSTTGLTEGASYYVINATTNTFQISNTAAGGTAVALTTNGTATLLPYKLAIVTITPQAGNNITTLDFAVLHSLFNTGNLNTSNYHYWNIGWLDVRFSFPNLTSLVASKLAAPVGANPNPGQFLSHMVSLHIVTSGSASISTQFQQCYNLVSVLIEQCSGSLINAFRTCPSLVTASILNTTAANASVTLTDAGDLITRSNHGYTNGMPVQFSNIVSTTGISASSTTSPNTYYVINATTNTFQISSFVNGSAVALTTDGTATIATSASNIFNSCPNLRYVYFNASSSLNYMDSAFSGCAYLSEVYLYNTSTVTNMTAMFQSCRSLQSVPLFNTAAVTGMATMFQSCRSLQSVPLFNTAAVTNMSSMFDSCYSLQSVPLFDTAAVTNMSSMCVYCYSLQSVPLFNTAAVTNISSMFSNCYSLQSVPLFDTAAVTNMSSMFYNCYSLQSVPLFNTAAVTNMTYMFQYCSSLQSVPLFNTAAVTTMSYMFYYCSSLRSVPSFNTALVGYTNYMFAYCYSLQSVPAFNAPLYDTQSMFSNCTSLHTVPALNTSSCTNMQYMFNGCSLLRKAQVSFAGIPVSNNQSLVQVFWNCPALTDLYVTAAPTSGATSSANLFGVLYSLRRVRFTGLAITNSTQINLSDSLLSATALNELYTSLGTVVNSPTLTVTNNYGVASDTPSIATAKGWTVAGS